MRAPLVGSPVRRVGGTAAGRFTRGHDDVTGSFLPAPLPLVSLHAVHGLEHAGDVRVPGGNATLDECPTAPHRPLEVLEQLLATAGVTTPGLQTSDDTTGGDAKAIVALAELPL